MIKIYLSSFDIPEVSPFWLFLLVLVGTSGLDMARLLALVADTLAFYLRGTITGNMADFSTL
jgi:hypothetical protein